MCEILGFSGSRTRNITPYLKTLTSHSPDHPHGWGIATFYANAVNLEKEPKTAWLSDYLCSRLSRPVEVSAIIAHIRHATRGSMKYENCHPFVRRDNSGRAWTLAHNGTIFESPFLDSFKDEQEGETDSERVLCYIVSQINKEIKRNMDLCPGDRFRIVESAVVSLAGNNKLNLLIYDGDLLYVHTNMAGTLYSCSVPEGVLFATVPLDDADWQPVPMMQLHSYHNGRPAFEGRKHSFEYIQAPLTDDFLNWHNGL